MAADNTVTPIGTAPTTLSSAQSRSVQAAFPNTGGSHEWNRRDRHRRTSFPG